MRRYETIFIVRPNIAEDEIEAVTSKASSIIEGDGGTIIKVDKWGLKKLAYLIKKEARDIMSISIMPAFQLLFQKWNEFSELMTKFSNI